MRLRTLRDNHGVERARRRGGLGPADAGSSADCAARRRALSLAVFSSRAARSPAVTISDSRLARSSRSVSTFARFICRSFRCWDVGFGTVVTSISLRMVQRCGGGDDYK